MLGTIEIPIEDLDILLQAATAWEEIRTAQMKNHGLLPDDAKNLARLHIAVIDCNRVLVETMFRVMGVSLETVVEEEED